jgi:diacylglycerol kinase family enzyme
MPAAATVILNPSAGSHGDIDRQVAAAFAAVGLTVTIETVTGVAVRMRARQAVASGAEIVVAAGGDGTVSAVASAVAGHSAALGVIQCGRVNHFAKDVGIPLDITEAARVIANGRTMSIDVAEVNGRTFVNNASLGVYSRLVYEREREEREGRSHAVSLALAAARVWSQYRRVRVAVVENGIARVVSTPFVFVGNNEYELRGLSFGGRRTLSGGRLHVCMAPNVTRAGALRVLLAALAGRLESFDQFESLTLTELLVEAHRPQLAVSLDGEVAMLNTPLRYRIHPGALGVLVPA